jgi:xanthine dehydrogenase accessory factor
MRDVMTDVKAWLEQGDPVAVATVISTWGSAPRPAGSRMAISQSGKIAGSVSGGCLEGEVFEQAQAILKGKPASLFHYGVSDDLAWTVGLSCGGEIDVLVEPLAQVHRDLMTALEAERPVVLRTDVGERPGASALLTPADPDAAELLDRENPVRQDGHFLEPFPRPPELFIFGGSHVAIPLTRLASAIGFRVTVVDARSKFADKDRFPEARRVIKAWPDEILKDLPMDGSTGGRAISAPSAARRPIATGWHDWSRPASTRASSSASMRRSASTSEPRPPRKRRSRSSRKWSRCAMGSREAQCPARPRRREGRVAPGWAVEPRGHRGRGAGADAAGSG